MSNKIRVGIVGYGNLGKGVELALEQNPDFQLEAIFTRRNPEKLLGTSKMVHISEIEGYKGKIDIMILCGGSATDLPQQTPEIAKMFNTVDSFDNHANIPEHFNKFWDYWTYIRWMGSWIIFIKSSFRSGCASKWQGLYFLGKRCKSRTL